MSYYNPTYFPYYPQQYINNQSSQLNGKIVDGYDAVKAADVPIGSYGVFPKADLGEIYIKSWNNNGTTSITVFKPENKENEANEETLKKILQRIEVLENKVNDLFANNRKEEVLLNANEY